MTKQRPFAVFDIDGTLIRWQLFHAVVHKLGQEGYVGPEHHQSIKTARMHWKNRETTDEFSAYEQLLITTYLSLLPTINPHDHARMIDEVVAEYKDQTFTYTRELVRSLKEQGYSLFAVSGSHQEAVERVARHHGFDAAIGCQFFTQDGHFTGDYFTPIHDKKAALEQLVAQHSSTYAGSYAVGDSLSDAAMLRAVEHPIAFNPDKKLYTEARANHWPIVVERKNVIYELSPDKTDYKLS